MPNPALSVAQALEAVEAYKTHGTQRAAARALGLSKSTYQSRLERAHEVVDSSVVRSILHETRFHEVDVDDGVVLICSDVHCWPGPFTMAQNAFIWFAKHLRPSAIVINGDLFDGIGLSRFPSSNWNQKPSVKDEVDACVKFLSAVEKAAPGSRRFFVPGNHDERFNRRLIAEVPEFAGVPGFDLYSLFPEWTLAYRLTLNRGKPGMTDIVHNWAGGVHAAYNNVLRSGVNYVTGHTHRNLVRPWMDRTGIRFGVESGTLAGIDHPSAYYVAGRPADWHPGFIVLTMSGGRLMRPEHVDVAEDGVCYRGVVAAPPDFS